MASEKIQVGIESKYDDKGAKAAIKDVEKLEKAKPTIKVGADVKAAERDITGLLKKVEKLDAEPATLLLSSNATQIAKEIAGLVIDLDKLDANDPTIDVKTAQINALQGDLDKVVGKIKEVNNVPVDVDTSRAKQGLDDVGRSADSSKSVLANMVGNATQDLGALGGIAGSAGVAIGQMGEYMVDAKADGDKFTTVLRNFAMVAGPIALIGVAIQVATGVMNHFTEEAAAAEARAKSMGEAMEGAANDAVGIAQALRDDTEAMRNFIDQGGNFGDLIADNLTIVANNIPLIGEAFEQTSTDIVTVANKAGLSIYDLANAAGGVGSEGWKKYDTALREAVATGKISKEQSEAMRGFMGQQSIAIGDANAAQKLYNVDQKEANALLDEFLTKKDPLKAFTNEWSTLQEDMRDGSIDTETAAEAINTLATELGLTREEVIALAQEDLDTQMAETAKATGKTTEAMKEASNKADALQRNFRELSDTMRSTEWGDAELQGALTGMSAFTEELFALGNIAQAQEEAFLGFNESVKDVGLALDETTGSFDLTTEAGRKQQDALEELAGTIDTEMAAAFDQADGDFAKFKTNAEGIANKTLKRLQHELGLSDEETEALGRQLGLLPEDIETRYELSGDEEAKIKIGLLQGAIDDLPKSVQTQVHQQIIKGDYVGALDTIQNYYDSHPAKVRITFVTPQNLPQYLGSIGVGDRGGIAPSEGLIVAERRPEFVQLPGARQVLLTEPSFVPSGTRVTSGAETERILTQSALERTFAAPPMTNVTINLPRGTRPDDAVRAADRYARRNGRSRAHR